MPWWKAKGDTTAVVTPGGGRCRADVAAASLGVVLIFSSACVARTTLWLHDQPESSVAPADGDVHGGDSTLDCATQPHATLTCVAQEVYWVDLCGARTDLKEDCGPGGCRDGVCLEETWFALGDAEFAPWSQTVSWGSAAGGGISANGLYSSWAPALMLAPDGTPLVAWSEQVSSNNAEIYVAQWDGTAWVAQSPGSLAGGGISQTPGFSDQPGVGMGSDAKPAIAWSEAGEIYVRQWQAGAWSELAGSASEGGISNDAALSNSAALTFTAAMQPVVTWASITNSPLSCHVYARAWNGSAWSSLGASSANGTGVDGSSGFAMTPTMALIGNGNLLLAWADSSTNSHTEVYARQWQGTTWGAIGTGSDSGLGISQASCDIDLPHVVVRSDGWPLLAWNVYGTSGCLKPLGIHIAAYDGVSWTAATTPLNAESAPCGFEVSVFDNFHLVLDRDQPVIVAEKLRACAWRGGAWVELGANSAQGIFGVHPDIQEFQLAFDATGIGTLVWADWGEIYALRFDGSAWAPWVPASVAHPDGAGSGGVNNSDAGEQVFAPQLALTDTGAPMLAWFSSYDVKFKAWNGADWVEYAGSAEGGGVANAGGAAYGLQLAWHAATGPVLAWAGFDTLWLARFDGTAWVDIGLGSASTGIYTAQAGDTTFAPALALTAGGRPVLAWSDGGVGTHEIYVLAFDGTMWAEVGVGSAQGGGISNSAGDSLTPALALDSDAWPVVAWSETVAENQTAVYARRFDGTSWAELGTSAQGLGLSASANSAREPAVSLEADSQPVVAWSQLLADGEADIYVRRFDGSAWLEMGTGSAQGGGVSASAGISQTPVLVRDSADRMVLAWNDRASGNFEIYLRRWDGTAWVEVQGSASGGGLSNSLGSGFGLAVAARAGLTCATWDELGPVGEALLVRCSRH